MKVSLIHSHFIETSVKEDPGIKGGESGLEGTDHMSHIRHHIHITTNRQNGQGPDHLEKLPANGLFPDAEKAAHIRIGFFKESLGGNKGRLIQTVIDKLPVCSMPDTDQDKDHKGRQKCRKYFSEIGIHILFQSLLHFGKGLGESDGVKDIVLHPVAQRDMPSLPELGYTPCHIRLAEVFLQLNAEHL